MALYIGIDSGTQSTKAIVLDLDSREVIAEARAPHSLIEGLPDGHLEQHPRQWVEAMETCIHAVLAKVDRTRVRAIGVSGQQHGFVPLDASFEVIRPAKLWCDTSTVDECALLTRKLGGEKAALRKGGLLFLPGFTAPKILWLKRHERANYRRLRHVALPHDYLNWHLCGRLVMEYGDASGTALLDVRKRQWSAERVRAIDPSLMDALPELVDSSEPLGVLRPELADAFGLPRTVLVSTGGGDNMMGAIGTGNVRPGVVTASFGTSGTVYAFSKKPVIDPEGEIAAFCSSTGGWLPLLCTMNVTSATEQVRHLFGQDLNALERAVAGTEAGAKGALFLPYLVGERTPNVPSGTGVWFGLTPSSMNPAALARSAIEGVTLGLNFGVQRLRKLGLSPKEIRVTGGGAKSPAWRQVMADVFGVPVVAMKAGEGAALGAALQAAWVSLRRDSRKNVPITEVTDAVVAVDEATRCTPDKRRATHYKELQRLQNELSAALRPLFNRRAELRKG